MLIFLSPSKKLDEAPVSPPVALTHPAFIEESQALVARLKGYSAGDLQALMGVSEKIAALNVARYRKWCVPFTPENAKPALFLFKGDVYDAMDVAQYDAGTLAFAQAHLRILSGLYGLLRPLDLMQPYRLEMGTRLANDRGKHLYAFWGDKITDAVNEAAQASGAKAVINLASNEYFKAVQPEKLVAPLVSVEFREHKNGTYKIIGLMAKRARGMMADWIIRNRINDPAALKNFTLAGYAHAPERSAQDMLCFTREHIGKSAA